MNDQMVIFGNAQIRDLFDILSRLYVIYLENVNQDEIDFFDYTITVRENDLTKKPELFIMAFGRGIFKFPTRVEACEFADAFQEQLLAIKDLI